MKSEKTKGIKARVVVRIGDEGEKVAREIILYRGGKMGLAFRSPVHRVFTRAALLRRDGGTTKQPPSVPAAGSQGQGGL